MFCMKCGTQLPDDAVFCCKCGNRVSAAVVNQEQSLILQEPCVQQEVQVVLADNSQTQAEDVVVDKGVSRFEKLMTKANQGNVLAQMGLADAYLNGKGCDVDKQKAVEWYQKAADQGDEDAKKMLASLGNDASSEGGGFWNGLFKIGVALVGGGAYIYQETHLASSIIDDVKFAFCNNRHCYVKGNIPQEYFDNAMNAYARPFGVDPSDVCLLFDDTIMLNSGSIGFMVTDGRIITSRKLKISFTEIDKVYLKGMDIMVRNRKGVTSCIYTVDSRTEGLSELFSRINQGLEKIRAEMDENITNNPDFKIWKE